MTDGVANYIQDIATGEPQSNRRMAVCPLILKNGRGPDYLTLSQGMRKQMSIVTEISESGSVPDLRVENKSDRPILFLDKEELVDTKQNRVLSTSMLERPNPGAQQVRSGR